MWFKIWWNPLYLMMIDLECLVSGFAPCLAQFWVLLLPHTPQQLESTLIWFGSDICVFYLYIYEFLVLYICISVHPYSSPDAHSIAAQIESDLIWFRYQDKTRREGGWVVGGWMFKISKIEEEEGLRSHCGLSMPRHTIHSPYRVIQYHTILYYIERHHNCRARLTAL